MPRSKLEGLLQRILEVPLSTWAFLALFVAYLFFFIGPVFFTTNVMQFFHYVPAAEHIGIDLKQTLSFSQYWLAPDRMHYVRSNNYPPLASLLFVPLLGLRFSLAFQVLTVLSVLAYGFAVLVLPGLTTAERRPSSLPAVLCITGLLSYGFQFELERGQFDAITFLLALLAVWIYHRHHSHRWLAYILFSLSVQLKLYPLIFAVMFIGDWHDWKNNLRRILLLVLANILFLFAFGLGVFTNFLNASKAYALDPYIWVGNHSIGSAVALALRLADRHGASWLDAYSVLIQIVLLAVVAGCVLLIVLRAFSQHRTGLNAHLLLACVLMALLVAPFSHDYRLTILAAPVTILLLAESSNEDVVSRPARIILILILSLAYASTLFSFVVKPFVLANNFPALLTMLVAAAALSLLPQPADSARLSGSTAGP